MDVQYVNHISELTERRKDDDNLKTGKINFHFFHSYIGNIIFKSVFIAAAISAVALTPAAMALMPIVGLTIPILIGIGIGALVLNIVIMRKKLLFEVSLIYTVFTTSHWATRIDDHLILGAIPLENHGEWLQKHHVKVLVTLLEPFELEPGLVTPLDTIERKHFHAKDYLGVPASQLKEVVDFIKEKIDAQETVYVHCKAGRGRRTAAVISFLRTHGINQKTFTDETQVYNYVKALRPQINLNANQRKTVTNYREQYITAI